MVNLIMCSAVENEQEFFFIIMVQSILICKLLHNGKQEVLLNSKNNSYIVGVLVSNGVSVSLSIVHCHVVM